MKYFTRKFLSWLYDRDYRLLDAVIGFVPKKWIDDFWGNQP